MKKISYERRVYESVDDNSLQIIPVAQNWTGKIPGTNKL